MLRLLACLFALSLLTACYRSKAPSPQDTSPTHKAMCADLRNKAMLNASNGRSSIAVNDAQDQHYQEAYKNQCE